MDAAISIQSRRETLREQVYNHIYNHGTHGATDEEVQDQLNMNPSTQRPRRVELVRAGFVVDSGFTRRTTSNRQATVWVAVIHTDAWVEAS
jgi:hypothetical protein